MKIDNIFKISLIILLTFTSQVKAQGYGKTSNIKLKKCYAVFFSYDQKSVREEIDCSEIEGEKREKTKKQLIKIEQNKFKMIAYQAKLKKLGYDVDITGFSDEKTIKSHNKYIKKRKKKERRKQRIEKRKAKSK